MVKERLAAVLKSWQVMWKVDLSEVRSPLKSCKAWNDWCSISRHSSLENWNL